MCRHAPSSGKRKVKIDERASGHLSHQERKGSQKKGRGGRRFHAAFNGKEKTSVSRLLGFAGKKREKKGNIREGGGLMSTGSFTEHGGKSER